MTWHPFEDVLVSCGYDNSIKLFKDDGDDWTCDATLNGHESTVWAVAFDAKGDRLASCSEDKSIKIWQVDNDKRSWNCVATLSGFHKRPVYDISWCKLTNHIATAGGDDSICVFKEDENEHSEKFQNFSLILSHKNAHFNDVNCVDWNPKQAGLLASCGDDGFVKIWKLNLEES